MDDRSHGGAHAHQRKRFQPRPPQASDRTLDGPDRSDGQEGIDGLVIPRAGVRQRDLRLETRMPRGRISLQLLARLDGRRRSRSQRYLARPSPSGLLSDPALRLPDHPDEDPELHDGQQDG